MFSLMTRRFETGRSLYKGNATRWKNPVALLEINSHVIRKAFIGAFLEVSAMPEPKQPNREVVGCNRAALMNVRRAFFVGGFPILPRRYRHLRPTFGAFALYVRTFPNVAVVLE
jgi:hypothetical protein